MPKPIFSSAQCAVTYSVPVRGKFLITVLAILGLTQTAQAEELRVHATAGASHAVGDPQASEYSWGGRGSLALELPLHRVIGLQLEASGLFLSSGDRPPARYAARDAGAALGTMVGIRLHPMQVAGPWLDFNGGGALTGDKFLPAFDTHIGYDFRVGEGRFDVGPFLGYQHIFQPNDEIRPEDAHIMTGGIHVALGGRAQRGDRDSDTIFDDEDACPDVPGIRTNDPRTNGCPRGDRDHDTVFDDEDACPDVPGVRTEDPKTNGCPRGDRDKDTVFDDEDACPDVPGVRTADPKTNGCPADRDNDGIPDSEDACPDIPGIKTNDPKTNGCPQATESVHVEENKIVLDDRVYFEYEKARVKPESFPLLQKLGKFLNDNSDISEISIEGHCDERGTEDFNQTLSEHRADAVKQLLIKFGVDAKRLTSKGFGKGHLFSQGKTEKDHQLNRRVEFIITRARPKDGAPKSLPNGGGQ